MSWAMDLGHLPRLTPEELHAVSFRPARLGRRGLDEEHVRAFRQQVEAEFVMLLSERAELQHEVSRLRRRVLGGAAAGWEVGYQWEDAHLPAVSILSRAQQVADHYVAEAQAYSRLLAQDARRRRHEILVQARSAADSMIEEAHGAASRAAEMAMVAPEAPHAPAAGDRWDPAARLAYLSMFSDIYRAQLRVHLDALLRDADEGEHAERAPLSVGGSGRRRPGSEP